MTETPGRLRALLDETLTGEPPLLDLVPDAVSSADHSRRRSRLMAGGAAVAVLAVAAGAAYGLAGHGTAKAGSAYPVSPGGHGGSPTSTAPAPKSHKSDWGIPGLFDDPGTPQQECAKLKVQSRPELSSPAARDYCVRALTQLRALLPDATVIVEPIVDFDQPIWSAPLVKTPDGATAPGFVQAYQAAARNPAKVAYTEVYFAFHTSRGDGLITYQTLPPGAKAKAKPGGDLPFGDGTAGHFVDGKMGGLGVDGVTATGFWYDLSITGVGSLYGAGGSTLDPSVKGDGKDHEVFPDGYVMALAQGEKMSVPNPYTATEIRDRIKAIGLARLVNGIGADPVSVAVQ